MRGEAVVRGDVVDRRDGAAVARPEEVLRPGEPGREVLHAVAGVRLGRDVGEPERAHGVAVAVVPLAERRRELAGPPAVHPDVPRLGDVLHPREHRVGAQGDEEGVVDVVVVVPAAGERDGEVEAEAVDVDLLHPVAQRVQHHPGDDRVAQVEGVAAAGDVDVVPALVEPVVGARVEAAPAEGRPLVTAELGGVVVDDVEDDLDAGAVQVADHRLDLVEDTLRVGRVGVAGVRGRRSRGCCSPSGWSARAGRARARW